MVAQLKTPDLNQPQLASLISGYNQLNDALAVQGLLPHHIKSTAIVDTGTVNLAAVVVLANSAKALYNAHIASTNVHVAADATNVTTSPDATSADQTAANTLLNELKADFNAHIALAASHRGIIGAGVATELLITTTDASDLATSKALAAAILLAFNRHFGAGAPKIVSIGT